MKSATVVVPYLPHTLLRGLAVALGTLASWLERRGRRAALENLRCVLPNVRLSQRKKIVRQTYQTFARTYLELFWSPRLNSTNIHRYVSLEISPAARQAMENGCIFAANHAGNFEWLSIATAMTGCRSMVIAQNFKNSSLNEVFRDLRQRTGQILIPQEGAMLRLFKHLKRGGCTAALVDLNVPPDQSATVIRCFGLETCVSVIHAALAIRTGRPLVPIIVLPEAARWKCLFLDPIFPNATQTHQEICQTCWDCIEPFILRQPENWMWLYKHWRYLPSGADKSAYPDYANFSKKFERLRATSP